jgi:hypothetical protein
MWAYLSKRAERKDSKTELLLGIAHDRIVHLGMVYVERGFVTQDEYENLDVYLYQPYTKLGGNGTTTRIMEEVKKLRIVRNMPKRREPSGIEAECGVTV